MINLISSTPQTVMTVITPEAYAAHCGMLLSPNNGYIPQQAVDAGGVWAADNGCFTNYDPKRIIRMLHKYRNVPGCKFVVLPDAFDRVTMTGDAANTLKLYHEWIDVYERFGYPPAFVLQNGFEMRHVPWQRIGAVFIGGGTQFKYSSEIVAAVREAKRRGLWVHMGRVNSPQRILYAKLIGCDSFDGTGYAINPQHIRRHLPYQTTKQLPLWEIAT